MKKLTNRERQRQLRALIKLDESAIDTSDIPEISPSQLHEGKRGYMYRPIKHPVTLRLDVDVVAWLKQGGRGYQTKANALLRSHMIRSISMKKNPKPVKRKTRPRRTG